MKDFSFVMLIKLQFTHQKESTTFIFIYTNNDNTFRSPNSNQFVDGTNTSSWQLTKQDHTLYVFVLQQVNICTHLCDGANVDHDNIINLCEKKYIYMKYIISRLKKETQRNTTRTKIAICEIHNILWSISVNVRRHVRLHACKIV